MDVDAIDGVPRCTKLVFTMRPGGREVQQQDLRGVNIANWVEEITTLGVFQVDVDPEFPHAPTADAKEVDSVKQAVSRRRTSAPPSASADRLQQVATVYNAAKKLGLEDIMDTFDVSRSTAARLLRQAREANLIPPRDK